MGFACSAGCVSRNRRSRPSAGWRRHPNSGQESAGRPVFVGDFVGCQRGGNVGHHPRVVFALTGGALAGAIAATLTVYFVAMGQGGLTPLRLVLSGVVISAAFSAIANFMIFKSPYGQAAQGVMFWMLGSVAGATWSKLWIPSAIVAVTFALLMAVSSQLDALAAGPDTAAALGINVAVLRQCLFFLQAILVGALVAVSGGIGFVGLVIPHIARLLVGPRHRRLVPAAMLCGAIFLVWVDVLARVAAIPQEIPLGVVTGIIGAPVFLMLMGRSHYRFGGQE